MIWQRGVLIKINPSIVIDFTAVIHDGIGAIPLKPDAEAVPILAPRLPVRQVGAEKPRMFMVLPLKPVFRTRLDHRDEEGQSSLLPELIWVVGIPILAAEGTTPPLDDQPERRRHTPVVNMGAERPVGSLIKPLAGDEHIGLGVSVVLRRLLDGQGTQESVFDRGVGAYSITDPRSRFHQCSLKTGSPVP